MFFANWSKKIKDFNDLPHSLIINLSGNIDADLVVKDFFGLVTNLNPNLSKNEKKSLINNFHHHAYEDYFPIKNLERNFYLKKDLEPIFEATKFGLINGQHIRLITIFNAEKLNDLTSNSLLKLIEECDQQTFILLITNNYQSILKTVRSRCLYLNINAKTNLNQIKTTNAIKALIYANYDQNEINFYETLNQKHQIYHFSEKFFNAYLKKDFNDLITNHENFFSQLTPLEIRLFCDYLIYLLNDFNPVTTINLIEQVLKFKTETASANPRISYIYLLNLFISEMNDKQ
ncbi:hypothetical protein [[Mycoplasma] cavipharyngis]|uniref:hypothetical protein n=1 Tax=[Mycoplasma] cavipharyngis TaxID=92757 RepID=UPI0037044AB6